MPGMLSPGDGKKHFYMFAKAPEKVTLELSVMRTGPVEGVNAADGPVLARNRSSKASIEVDSPE